MKSKLILILLFIACTVSAQDRALIKGRAVAGSYGMEGILVVNLTAEKETKTDSLGNFTITAKTGDLLILADYRIVTKKIRYTTDLIKNGSAIIPVEQLAIELAEVVINRNSNITSESLGLVPRGQKRYTVAERRLKAAGSFKPDLPMGMTGGFIPFDPVINALSGRSAELKRGIETEQKEKMLDILNGLFNEDEISGIFKIPKEYVKGFLFYIVEDSRLWAVLKDKNEGFAKFLMGSLAQKYLELLDEK